MVIMGASAIFALFVVVVALAVDMLDSIKQSSLYRLRKDALKTLRI